MTDTFGETTFPVALPTLDRDEAAGDPLLTRLGAFIKACVLAECGEAWAELYPGETPIAAVRFHDPNDGVFDDRDLPALFLYRSRQSLDRVTDDWIDDRSEVTALWVPPLSELGRKGERSPFANAIAKAMSAALNRGADPSWKVDGDAVSVLPDTFGSDLQLWSGLSSLINSVRVERVPVTIEMEDGSRPLRYTGAKAILETHELLERDPASWPDAAAGKAHVDFKNSADVTVSQLDLT